MKDDAQLLREYSERQCPAAFAALVERHLNLVYSAALRQVAGDAHRAEDVAQLVFCELARKARRLVNRSSLAGWLYTTARHVAARNQRAEQRRIAREHSAHSMIHDPMQESGGSGWEELRPVLDEALERLTESDREAVILRFLQNRSFAEVGAVLGVKENAARMRVERAMDRLRQHLTRRGIVSTAVGLGQTLSSHAVVAAPSGLAETLIPMALAKGQAAVGWAGWLARKLPWLFDANPWWVASSALVLGVTLSPLVPSAPPTSPPIMVQFDDTRNEPQRSPSPPAGPVETTWRWDSLASPDYRQFIANLRTNGAPEVLIHDVVSLEIQRHFKDRYAAARPSEPSREHWQKPARQGFDPEYLRQIAIIEREHVAVVRALFGDEARPNTPANLLFCQPDMDLVELAWLPPETALRAAAALEPLRDLEAAPAGETRSFTHDTLRGHQRQRRAALQGVLTSEQLEEYRRRTDRDYQMARVNTRSCDLTAEEFQRVAELNDHQVFVPGATLSDQKRMAQRLQGILPAEKIDTYLRGIDHTYVYALRVAEHLRLPETTADQAWRVKQQALMASDGLQKDASLDPAARQRALAEIADRAERDLRGLLGDDGFLVIRGDWPWWKQLRAP
jgi:RNA polymerase sigma factor (sigma-70 family)